MQQTYVPPISHDEYYTIYTRDVMGCGVAPTAISQLTVMWSMATAPIDNGSDQFHINHVVLLVKRPPQLPDAVSTDQLSTDDMIDVMHDVTPMTDVHDRSDSLQVSPAPAVTDDDKAHITALTRERADTGQCSGDDGDEVIL